MAKLFNQRPNESGEQFVNRFNRHLTDKIIDEIQFIANLSELQIKSILSQLNKEALEIIISECNNLKRYEVSQIASVLINEIDSKK